MLKDLLSSGLLDYYCSLDTVELATPLVEPTVLGAFRSFFEFAVAGLRKLSLIFSVIFQY